MIKNFFTIVLLFCIGSIVLNNCSAYKSSISRTRVRSNQGVITISKLSTKDPRVQTPATFTVSPDSLFIEYPQSCWNYKIEGTVKLFMDINKQGKSTNTKVTLGIDGGCDVAAWSAMKNATYNPTLDAYGNPVAARHTVTIIFKRK